METFNPYGDSVSLLYGIWSEVTGPFCTYNYAKGDFEGSLRESQKALTLLKDQSPADTAIFHMGLVYVHPKNPKKDNKRATYFFNRVIKGYPDSAWVEQAKIWVGVLDGVEKLKQVDLEIEERKRDRSR